MRFSPVPGRPGSYAIPIGHPFPACRHSVCYAAKAWIVRRIRGTWREHIGDHRSRGSDRVVRPRAHTVSWPVRSGAVPSLADSHTPRPESGVGMVGNVVRGETVVLTPVGEPGDSQPGRPQTGGPQTGDSQTGDSQPGDSRPGDSRPGDHRLGGTGKTQLAATLAHALWDNRAVDLLVWVTAFSRDAIVTAYAQALADIGIADADQDLEAGAARFLAWLAETGRPWLVVFDDLADPADLAGLWPLGPAGGVVVTTRRPGDALRGPGRRIVPVGPFTLREALAYLTARMHDDPGQRTEALDLATDLGCQD